MTTTSRAIPARPARLIALAGALAATAVLAACGGEGRQDADEVAGEFPVEVTEARFPARQRLAERGDLRLAIENVGDQEVPDLAVTIWTGDEKASGSFNVDIDQQGVSDPSRPVWILEHGYPKLLEPGVRPADLDDEPTAGAAAAQTDTFSFGAVPPGGSLEIVWRLTPVMAGTFTVHYEVAAGLQGKARAVTADGSPVEGEFVVTISDEPPRARVDAQGRAVVED
ncbi:MAG TPA: hypothetical protein VK919_13265 [Solirubrobacterales bacterium]|nr:hypothetical protein [Solirubrobacterales bacterium]